MCVPAGRQPARVTSTPPPSRAHTRADEQNSPPRFSPTDGVPNDAWLYNNRVQKPLQPPEPPVVRALDHLWKLNQHIATEGKAATGVRVPAVLELTNRAGQTPPGTPGRKLRPTDTAGREPDSCGAGRPTSRAAPPASRTSRRKPLAAPPPSHNSGQGDKRRARADAPLGRAGDVHPLPPPPLESRASEDSQQLPPGVAPTKRAPNRTTPVRIR